MRLVFREAQRLTKVPRSLRILKLCFVADHLSLLGAVAISIRTPFPSRRAERGLALTTATKKAKKAKEKDIIFDCISNGK